MAKLSERQIRGAQFLREALEVAVVERLCAEGLPEDARTELDQNLTRQRKAVADDDKTTFQALDDQGLACFPGNSGTCLHTG